MRSNYSINSGRGLTNILLMLILSVLIMNSVSAQSDSITPQAFTGSGFSYQGQLRTTNGLVNGTCDLQFSLWDALTGGNQLGTSQSINGVAVSNGNFTVVLNGSNQFGADAFNGQARWLQIAVKCGSDAGFTALNPRQALNPAPYAYALPGLRTQAQADVPNIIGGYEGNTITGGVYAATIAGGGEASAANIITDHQGSIGGGALNQAGNNNGFLDDALAATVGGGYNNQAIGLYATVPGGYNNTAGDYSFAAGRRAKATHQGSFVWADSTNADFSSTNTNQFAIRARNGLYLDRNAGQTKSVPVGTHYRDNAIIAWARVNASGVLEAGFNVSSVVRNGTGNYTVNLYSGVNQGFMLIPVVTPEVDIVNPNAASMRFPVVNQFAPGNTFDVYMFNGNFALADNDFLVMVTGRLE
jgi:hypothetical protein